MWQGHARQEKLATPAPRRVPRRAPHLKSTSCMVPVSVTRMVCVLRLRYTTPR